MWTKIIFAMICIASSAIATPLPGGGSTDFGSRLQQAPQIETRAIDAPSDTNVGPRALGAISESLPVLAQALADTSGTTMERIAKVSLSFLPAARNVIEARAEDGDFDKDYALQQQEAAERVVPNILGAITKFIDGLPRAVSPSEIFIPPVQTFNFDNPAVPNQDIEGFTIPETEFAPKIVIPDVKIQ
ncbi:uncharacterized protein [Palaemon carinicauda]|uniref:uncharacterized protein n=1 Tax=Palaemon carinicauda TaxID=392227 RepID=UPI0035B5DF22